MGTRSKVDRPLILVNVSGPDQPGITSSLTQVLAEGDATIVDIGQAVTHGLLSLSILFEVKARDAQSKSTIKDLLFRASELDLHLDYKVIDSTERHRAPKAFQNKRYRYALTLLGEEISARALHRVTEILARYSLNIDTIQRLSDEDLSCVEMLVSSDQALDRHAMKKELLGISQTDEVDLALQSEGPFRRTKRLVVLDMDSTLIENEGIDEFARELGVYDEVAAITHEAMLGKLDYDESLRRRCEKLKGLTQQDVDKVFARIKLTPGAEDLIRVLKALGYKVALISGGFSVVAEKLRQKLTIDYAYANQMEFKNGSFTGKVIPPIVNAQRKADLLDVIAQQERIHLGQVIAIGDGANDLLMLEKAGLGVAFNAKPVVREKAHFSFNQRNIRGLLHILGISARDISDVLEDHVTN